MSVEIAQLFSAGFATRRARARPGTVCGLKILDEQYPVSLLVKDQFVGDRADHYEAKSSGADTSFLTHVVMHECICRVAAGRM